MLKIKKKITIFLYTVFDLKKILFFIFTRLLNFLWPCEMINFWTNVANVPVNICLKISTNTIWKAKKVSFKLACKLIYNFCFLHNFLNASIETYSFLINERTNFNLLKNFYLNTIQISHRNCIKNLIDDKTDINKMPKTLYEFK